MRSLMLVTDPNSDGLLTVAEGRTALGITGTSRDDDIARAIGRISATVFKECKLAVDGINPPTLLSEEITETVRLQCNQSRPLRLARRRVTGTLVITEGETELTVDTDYEIDRAAGLIYRLGATDPTYWPLGAVTIEYTAGFLTVPEDLKLAAEIWLRQMWRDQYETPATILDPFVKVEDIPGVRRVERWVSAMNSSAEKTAIPPEVESILYAGGYIETWIS